MKASKKSSASKIKPRNLRSRSDAIIDLLAGFIGTISFVMLQISACAFWTFVNADKIPDIAPFDTFPYPLLSAITSFEAVLIAAFVLMKQNRIGIIADRRDHLDLQVNLLTERRATQVIRMLNRVSAHLGSNSPKTRIAKSLNGGSPSNIWWKRCIAG